MEARKRSSFSFLAENVGRRSWRNWEGPVFFRINLPSRSLNRFKDDRLLIIPPSLPPLLFILNLTFLLFSFNISVVRRLGRISLANFLTRL